jgi:NDP-sugar pyrophosphorylase family protein
MENTINFEPALGYVCLDYPKELKDKLATLTKSNLILSEAQQKNVQSDFIKKNGSLFYEIVAIHKDEYYKVGDKVMIEGYEIEQKSILKPKESWKEEDKPEFDVFLFTSIGQIQGKLIY